MITLRPNAIFLFSYYYHYFFNVYFWEREHKQERGRDRLWAVRTEPHVGLELMKFKIMIRAEVGCSTYWATQVPQSYFLNISSLGYFIHEFLSKLYLRLLFPALSVSIISLMYVFSLKAKIVTIIFIEYSYDPNNVLCRWRIFPHNKVKKLTQCNFKPPAQGYQVARNKERLKTIRIQGILYALFSPVQ